MKTIRVFNKMSDIGNLRLQIDRANLDSKNLLSGTEAYLPELNDVCVSENIDGDNTLSFKRLPSEKTKHITEDAIILCDGKLYRIVDIDGDSVSCDTIYKDGNRKHIQNFEDYIGKPANDIITEKIIPNCTWMLPFTDTELKSYGMEWVKDKTDFFEKSKTTVVECIETLRNTLNDYSIHSELFELNGRVALVKSMGQDRGVRIDTMINAKDIVDIKRESSKIVTRLYPYGVDDLHIGSVNDKVQYIESPNINDYPEHEGYMMFDNIDDPNKLIEVAYRQFDPDNPDRVDVPSYSANIQNVSRQYDDIRLGDVVTIVDRKYGQIVKLRVIERSYYPFEPNRDTFTLGGARASSGKLLTDILKQNLEYRLSKNKRGQVKTSALELSKTPVADIASTGYILTNNCTIKDRTNKLIIDGSAIKLYSNSGSGNTLRLDAGTDSTGFNFTLYDEDGEKAAYVDASGKLNLCGASGTFETPDGKTITVEGGTVTNILGGEENGE